MLFAVGSVQMSRWNSFCLLVAVALQSAVRAQPLEYLPNPEVEWERSLAGDVGAGNGAVISSDEHALYVTTSNGVLTALAPVNGLVLGTFVPQQNNQGWEVSCHSTVDMYEETPVNGTVEMDPYLIHVVVDTAPEGEPASSRQQRYVPWNHRL